MNDVLSKVEPERLKLTPNGRTKLGNILPGTESTDVTTKGQMEDAISAASNGGGAAFPAEPELYQKFFLIPDGDNTDGKLYTYNGTNWV